ncbi:MAG: leucine-rich repeat protein [Lachnospiraceae bacterium]|nr:leucine-rich repeat protein [Lachnospiraceae bacterium]
MKKFIARCMAAAMLLTAMPAMTLPAINVEAAPALRYDYTTAFSSDYEANGSNRVALRQTYLIAPSNGMTQISEHSWDTNVIIYGSSDEFYDPYSSPAVTTAPSSDRAAGSETLNPASFTMASAQESKRDIDGDYYDPNGFVKRLTTNGSGHLIITLKDEFSDSQKRLIREGSANYFDVYVWPDDDAYKNGTYFVRFQVGEYYRADSTKLKDCYTADGYIREAQITIDEEGDATLIEVSDYDKKTRMKKQKIELNEIYVSGVPYTIAEIDEQCFKKAKMKQVTAEHLEKIGNAAFRQCTNLKTVKFQKCETEKIMANAFLDCESLSTIRINGEELKKIGSKAFYGLKKNCKISIKGTKAEYKKVLKLIRASKTSGVKCSRVSSDDEDEDEDD